jgi:hypothetical protein
VDTPPRTLFSGHHPLLWLVVAVMLAMTAMVVTSSLPVILDAYLHDDSFYYLKVAENFATGHGSTFDGVNYTNGYQPGWFAVLTGLYAVGVDHESMVTVGIVVQSLFYVAGMVVLSATFISAGRDPAAAAVAIGVVFCSLVPVLGWNLLESGLTLLATALLLYGLVRKDIPPVLLGLILAFAGIARTDHLLFLPLVAAWVWWHRWRANFDRREVVAFVLPIAVVIGGYLLLNLITAGHIMPVSGRVKAFYSANSSLLDTLTQLMQIDVRQSWKIGAVVAVAVLIRDLHRRSLGAPGLYAIGALTIGAYYQLTYITAFSAAFWYYIPLYVLFAFGVAIALDVALAVVPSKRVLGIAVLALGLATMLGGRVRLMESYRQRSEGERADTYRVALVLREKLANPHFRAGAWDAGILGYYGGRVTNLDGLINSADFLEQYLSRNGTADYIHAQRFEFIVCYEPDAGPGGKAERIMDRYRPIFRDLSWVILERKP